MDLGTLGTVGAVTLTAVSGFMGLLFKRGIDRQNAKDAREKATSEREDERAQKFYDQMQEDLDATRGEVRALQNDLTQARTEMTRQQEDAQRLWTQFAAVRRELDAAEAHIADVHRWDDHGRQGPMPQRKEAAR